jgi:hypothetical protein
MLSGSEALKITLSPLPYGDGVRFSDHGRLKSGF